MLTPKHQLFIAAYLANGLNATQAAIKAGYSAKTAAQAGHRLIRHVEIAAEIVQKRVEVTAAAAAVLAEEAGEELLTAERVLLEVARLAFVDKRAFFDEFGNLKPIKDLTPAQGACLASFEVIKKNAEAGDGIIDTVHKFKVWDKPKALDMLMKHFNLMIEKAEVDHNVTYRWGGDDDPGDDK